MASFKHKFTSAKGDGTDTTLVQPSNWNDEHAVTVSQSGVVLGRTSAGAGDVEEVPITDISPPKATGADVTTGTDDTKFVTPKALSDAGIGSGGAVRYDSVQALTSGQKTQAQSNMGLGSAATKTAGAAAGNVPVLDGSGRLATSTTPTNVITSSNIGSQSVAHATTADTATPNNIPSSSSALPVGWSGFMIVSGGGGIADGATVAGSNLRIPNAPSGTFANSAQSGGTQSGTWRCIAGISAGLQYVALFVRIA